MKTAAQKLISICLCFCFVAAMLSMTGLAAELPEGSGEGEEVSEVLEEESTGMPEQPTRNDDESQEPVEEDTPSVEGLNDSLIDSLKEVLLSLGLIGCFGLLINPALSPIIIPLLPFILLLLPLVLP